MRAGQSPDIFCKHHFLKPLKMLLAKLICTLGWCQGGWPTLLGRGMGAVNPYHQKLNKLLKLVNNAVYKFFIIDPAIKRCPVEKRGLRGVKQEKHLHSTSRGEDRGIHGFTKIISKNLHTALNKSFTVFSKNFQFYLSNLFINRNCQWAQQTTLKL